MMILSMKKGLILVDSNQYPPVVNLRIIVINTGLIVADDDFNVKPLM